MEISPNSETNPRVRRRLIQSTLFPHKSQDNAVCVDEIESDVDQEDDEEDNCGSQNQVKKGKKRKPKAASQSRASRKVCLLYVDFNSSVMISMLNIVIMRPGSHLHEFVTQSSIIIARFDFRFLL
ncbi:hypothetical protein SSX86_033191 [Deinandra increscens subsp. villosa]|uniref:Uncharacterized protein n=1 Tax=Deinandra increscens subsp. villosa TaxID=3103831 RepID=A0AAP0GGM4_9ASTR